MAQASDYSDVFISYRRKDVEFTKKLVDGLKAAGKEVWIDWEDIPPGSEAFTDDIKRGLEGADAFICILTPDYLESTYCVDLELGYAAQLNKKTVPILLKPITGLTKPESVRSINWVYFVPNAGHQNTFEESLPKVIEALDSDPDHNRDHARLGLRAIEWNESDRDSSYLLTGNEIAVAEAWLVAAASKVPRPTELHVEYINTSRDVQLALQAQQLRLQQSAIRRLRIIVGLAVGAAVIAAILLGTIVQLGRNLRNTTEANTFTLAEQSLAAGNYDRAIAYYNTVIDEFDAAEGYEGRGQSHLGDGDYEAAIADFTLALENGDVSADIYYNRGQAYARLSQWEQAIADYDAAVDLDGEYVDAYYRQGIAHIQSGDIESALEDFDTAIDLDPTYAAAYNERGKVSLQAGEFEDALEDFQEASQIQPTYAEAVYNEGMAYLGMEDRSNAVEAFTEAILIDPNYALAYYQRGLVFAQNGSIEEAMFNYGLSTRLDTTLASTEAFNLYLETLENAGYSFDLPEDYQHTVRSTETLATISLQYNLMATELILLNELEDGTFLVPGRVLRLSEEGRGDDGPPPRSEARLQQPPPPDASDGVRPPRPGDGNPPPTPSEPGGNNDGRLRFDTDDDGPDDASPGGRDDDGGDDDNIGDGD